MKINKYQMAMFSSYWLPTFIFYILPSLLLSLAFSSQIDIGLFVVSLVSVPCALFSMGALIAPYFGPKVLANKYLAFLMAVICQSFSIFAFIISQGVLSGYAHFTFLLAAIFFLYSLLPAMLGALLFIGSCEKIIKETQAL